MLFRDGVEETMRNASFLHIIIFHVDNKLHFPKEASKSNPPTCIVESLQFEHQNILLCMRLHTKRLTQWHPKLIASGVNDTYLAKHCILVRPPLLQQTIWVHKRIILSLV